MAKVLIVYYSRSVNTKRMAELVKSGVEKEGLGVVLKEVENTKVKDLLEADTIIMGSPVYYGSMAAPLKKLLDDSVSNHGDLDGKIGGAFSSSANIGGGNETTILDILNAMLIHGMIIQGDPKGDHYGPVSIGKPDQRAEKECLRFGQRLAQLTKNSKDKFGLVNKDQGGVMPQVKVYSTPTCPYCIRLKEYLKQKSIEFSNIDVSVNKAAVEEMVKLTGQMGVPVISIDGNVVVGFDRAKIDSLLNIV